MHRKTSRNYSIDVVIQKTRLSKNLQVSPLPRFHITNCTRKYCLKNFTFWLHKTTFISLNSTLTISWTEISTISATFTVHINQKRAVNFDDRFLFRPPNFRSGPYSADDGWMIATPAVACLCRVAHIIIIIIKTITTTTTITISLVLECFVMIPNDRINKLWWLWTLIMYIVIWEHKRFIIDDTFEMQA